MKEKNSENKKRKIVTIDLEALKDLKDSEIIETLSKTKSQLINNAKKIKENKENVEKIEKLSDLLNDTFDNVFNTCSEKYKEIKNKKDIKESIDKNKKAFDQKGKNDISCNDLINYLKNPEYINEIEDDSKGDCFEDCPICFDENNEDDEYDYMLDIMNSVYFIKKSPIFVILEDNIAKGKVKKIDFNNQKLIVSLPVDNDEFELLKKVPFEMLGISATQNEDKVDDLVEYYHLKEAINQKLWIDKEGNAFSIQELTITELKNIKNTIENIFDDPIEESKPKLWYYDKFLDIIEEATFDL